MSEGQKILESFAAEKTKGSAVEMVKATDCLFKYVLNMNFKDPAPAAELPRF